MCLSSGRNIAVNAARASGLEKQFGNGVVRWLRDLPHRGFPSSVDVLLILWRSTHSEVDHLKKLNPNLCVYVVKERELREILTGCQEYLSISVKKPKVGEPPTLEAANDDLALDRRKEERRATERRLSAIPATDDEAFEMARLQILTQPEPDDELELMIMERREVMDGTTSITETPAASFTVLNPRRRAAGIRETRWAEELKSFAPLFIVAPTQGLAPGYVSVDETTSVMRKAWNGRTLEGRALVLREWLEPVVLPGNTKTSGYRAGKVIKEFTGLVSVDAEEGKLAQAQRRIARAPALEAMKVDLERAFTDGERVLGEKLEKEIADLRKKHAQDVDALRSGTHPKIERINKELAELPALAEAMKVISTGEEFVI